MSSNEVIIDGVVYVPQDSGSEVRIVIAQRGWVFVGKYSEDGDDVTLTGASVIRSWGTTKGLGELVNGPLAGTKLDKAGTVRLHKLGIVASLDCGGSWAV